MERKTPLYDTHVAMGGKIVEFGGYLLPVQYKTGVIAEHMAVRTKAGLFDVSHMAEMVFKGPDALANIQMLMTNDFSDMTDGQVRYSPMCNEKGGVVDDLVVYRFGPESYMAVVNAANRDKDREWMKAHLQGNVEFEDISDQVAQLALQGPNSQGILEKLCAKEDIPEKYYSFVKEAPVAGIPCLISRTGYTGEDGFELYCGAEQATQLWNALLEAGKEEGLIPCGLGARDTLRLEAGMPLYGHEMNDDITPKQTALGIFVKMDKEDFIGKKAMEEMGTPTIKRCGLKVLDRGIVREHCPVFADGRQIGETTSGTHCPYLGCAVAMAIVEKEPAPLGAVVEVEVRGRRLKAEVVKNQFYKRG
jgi:aminomethyltransferase